MRSRFEVLLKQLAEAQHRKAAGSQEPAPRRRRRVGARRGQVIAERIAFGVGLVLAVSSLGFAAYAIDTRVGRPLAATGIMPSLAHGVPTNRAMAAARRRDASDPAATGSVREAADTAEKPAAEAAGPAGSDIRMAGHGYVVRQVVEGAALVEGPDGIRQVMPGAVLPGAGRIMSIEQSRAGWIVVTSETVIGSAPL